MWEPGLRLRVETPLGRGVVSCGKLLGIATYGGRHRRACLGADAGGAESCMFSLGLDCSQIALLEFLAIMLLPLSATSRARADPRRPSGSKQAMADSRRSLPAQCSVPPGVLSSPGCALRRCITPDEQDIVSRCWSCHWYFDSYEHSRIPDQFHAGDPSVPNAMNPMQRETSKPYLTPPNPAPLRDTP
jgi:hypothetical protein